MNREAALVAKVREPKAGVVQAVETLVVVVHRPERQTICT